MGDFSSWRHAVDEVRLPLVEPDALDRNQQVQHHADQHQHQKDRADDQQHPEQRPTGRPRATVSMTQPTISATTSTIITTASVIGQPSDLRMAVYCFPCSK